MSKKKKLLDSPETKLNEGQERCGWDDESKLFHVNAFIEEQGDELLQEFHNYIDDVMEEEDEDLWAKE
tara:strand:+ start:31045 stop:31248 length:204 start_codon:yes stop_codon:yes gene_type:complete